MLTPLCEMCVKNEDILCAGCERKLTDGKITHTDVDFARVLSELTEKHKTLKEAEFLHAVNLPKMMLVITPKGRARVLIGRGGRVSDALEKRFNKRVKIIEEGTVEDVVREAAGRAKVIGVNEVYSQDARRLRIRISARDRVRTNPSELISIVKAVTDRDAEVLYE